MTAPFPRQLASLAEDVGALLEEHRRGSPLESFATYADRPEAFAAEVLRIRLTDQQLEVVRAARESPLTCVVGGVAVGKDLVGAVLALHWAICRQGLVLMTSSTERQAKGISFAEVRRLWAGVPDLPGQMFEGALRLPGTAGIYAFVSTSSSRMQGYHAPAVLAIGSEAQAFEDFVLEALLSCAVGESSRVVLLGNPLFASGAFHRAAHSTGWRRVDMPATAHINVVSGKTVVPGAVTRDGIERLRREFGAESPTFRSRVLAEFPVEDSDSLIRLEWLTAAVKRWTPRMPPAEWALWGPTPPPPVIVGLDVARHGGDQTVVAARQGDTLLHLAAWHGVDTMQTVGRLQATLRERGIPLVRGAERKDYYPGASTADVVVDSIGLGSGVYDRLCELGFPVSEFIASKSPLVPKDREAFLNLRAWGWWQIRRQLEEGRIALLDHRELLEELAAIRWQHHSSGRVQIESKDDLRSRLGRSTDYGDAVMMAFAETGMRFSSVRVAWA